MTREFEAGGDMNAIVNRQILLTARPSHLPGADSLQLSEGRASSPQAGQFLVKHLYIALSPSARIRMAGDSDYGPGMPVGEVVQGQTLGVVMRSRNDQFHEGDIVITNGGWQEYSLSSGKTAVKVDAPGVSPLDALGLLGTSGLTAFVGLTKFGKPVQGATLLVSAASGSVGSVAGQIGKILGCRVIGITGGQDKCRYLVDELHFDHAVDYRSPDFAASLARACAPGVDIYFENVGGAILDAALPLMADFGRVVLCGMVATYNQGQGISGPSWLPILTKRLTVAGFLLRDHQPVMQEFRTQATRWIAGGQLKMNYDVSEGIAEAPAAFARLLQGEKFGKSIVKVANV